MRLCRLALLLADHVLLPASKAVELVRSFDRQAVQMDCNGRAESIAAFVVGLDTEFAKIWGNWARVWREITPPAVLAGLLAALSRGEVGGNLFGSPELWRQINGWVLLSFFESAGRSPASYIHGT